MLARVAGLPARSLQMMNFPTHQTYRLRRYIQKEGVLGEAISIVSIVRNSVGQQYPLERSLFEIVPEAILVPKLLGLGFVTCSISWAKSKYMSVPAPGLPSFCLLIETSATPWSLGPSQASPRRSGVTATGEKEVGCSDC